jgi:ribosomal protein S27AE
MAMAETPTYYTVVYRVEGGRDLHNEWWRKVSNTFADHMLATGQAIRCPRCGAVSVHPKDIEEGYCGRCHDWTGFRPKTELSGRIRR